MKARLPTQATVHKALWASAEENDKKKRFSPPMTDIEAQLVANGLRYCQGFMPADKQDLEDCLAKKLARCDSEGTHAHVDLATLLYNKLRASPHPMQRDRGYKMQIRMLMLQGKGLEARDVLLQYEATEDDRIGRNQPTHMNGFAAAWYEMLYSVGRQSSEKEFFSTVAMIEDREWIKEKDLVLPEIILDFYLHHNMPDGVKKWLPKTIASLELQMRDKTHTRVFRPRASLGRVLRWCLEHGELDYGHQIVREVTKNQNPTKETWDAIFVWAAGTSKGADEIGRMMDIMQKSNEDIPDPKDWRLPDVATINGLVEYATSKGDPYLAERFIALGTARGIQANARTYQLQMEYRLKIGDVDGALIAYKNLQAMDLSSHEDVPTVNKLVVALCQSQRHDFDTVMNVAMDLTDRGAPFDAKTVSTLAMLHLRRDEKDDVVDLLNTYSHNFSSTERESIRKEILAFCVDPKTLTTRSWDAYTVLHHIFEETPRPERTDIMNNFYTRNRPDLAVFVFNEMRRHSRPEIMPTSDTYVASFLGSAKICDLESLEVVHNQLKLDYNININTYLINAMMIAYATCERPRFALSFWQDIVSSKEGPTYNSLHIVLRACEKSPFGDLRAKEIWQKLRGMDLELDPALWASYVAALAGNGDVDLAIRSVEEADEKNDLEVNAFVIGSLMDAVDNSKKQEDIESWAKEKYLAIWEELEKLGFEVDEDGKRTPKIDRALSP
jgi:hypothetical protein